MTRAPTSSEAPFRWLRSVLAQAVISQSAGHRPDCSQAVVIQQNRTPGPPHSLPGRRRRPCAAATASTISRVRCARPDAGEAPPGPGRRTRARGLRVALQWRSQTVGLCDNPHPQRTEPRLLSPDAVHEDPGALAGALYLTEAVITLRLLTEARGPPPARGSPGDLGFGVSRKPVSVTPPITAGNPRARALPRLGVRVGWECWACGSS